MRLSARRKKLILGVYIEESILKTTGKTRHVRLVYSLDSSISSHTAAVPVASALT